MDPAYYKSPLLRYYKLYTLKSHPQHDLYVRMHSNKLFLVFLHPSHPAMSQEIKEVSFKFSSDSISGKHKKGAVNLQPTSNLLEIKTVSETYTVKAGIFGKLIETNEHLVQHPNSLKDPESFLAVLMPSLSKVDALINDLLEPIP